MLTKMLQAHAMDSIGTPSGIPPCLIMAETGNYDLDLVTHKERLLMIHRAINNPLDTKTEALMHAATETHGLSAKQAIKTTLKALGVDLLPDIFLIIPYHDVKHILKEALTIEQDRRWRLEKQTQPTWFHRHYRCKAKWGIDPAIQNLPNNMASAFILFRLNYRAPLLTPMRKTCIFCKYHDPGISHFMWQCEKLNSTRNTLIETIRHILPQNVYNDLSLSDLEPLTDYLLGTGESSLSAQNWKRLVQATAEFITNIYSQAAESVECPLSIPTEEVTGN
jgi:hypothetical protein